ncbi:ROK family protein [Pseudonocardia sp. MH-G8]|uniref:ROK family protein n=1 Tax=Pseudonocardia sp. MH-G8 TaxID=1854588 RepID=UPI001304039B|nr:ROK family protein [Pseudonocardia sp. MH-G8]
MSSYNRSVILDAIRSTGPISRVELAAATGLTGAAMTNLVRRLLADGLIEEAGQGASTGGKPRTLLRLNASAGFAVGVLVDVDAISYVVSDLEGRIVARARAAGVDGSEPLAVLDRVARGIRRVLARSGVPAERVLGVGMSAPRPLDQTDGRALRSPAHLERWRRVPVRERLEELVGHPVLLSNDANAVVLGEHWLAPDARAAGNVLCVFLGELGIGSGILLNGKLVLGSSPHAGEIGHLSLNVDGETCFCGNRGCLELYSSPHAVAAAARAHNAGGAGEPIALATGGGARSDVAAVRRAVAEGHPHATDLVRRSARYVGSAVQLVVDLLDLQLVIFAGHGFGAIGHLYVEAAQVALRRLGETKTGRTYSVRLSTLGSGEDAAAVGAAALVLHRHFEPALQPKP